MAPVARRKKMQTEARPTRSLHCSFCGKERRQVAQLVAGPGVHICDACIGLCNRMLTGKPTATFASWASLTDEELLSMLPASAAAVEDVEANLREHIQALRRRGISWERIAGALGVSRQAAWERFSRES
jgi:hypothetical protein